MSIVFAGISAARARLARLAQGLHQAAGGEVLARAAAKVQEQVRAVATAKLSAHELSGAALGSVQVTAAGGLVQLTTLKYPNYHRWWPFRRGMPPFVVSRANVILARELLSALDGQGGALGAEAAGVVEEAEEAAGKAAKSAAEKAKTRALNKAARDRERADKKAERESLRGSRAHARRLGNEG